jgi:hypothetical protein
VEPGAVRTPASASGIQYAQERPYASPKKLTKGYRRMNAMVFMVLEGVLPVCRLLMTFKRTAATAGSPALASG